MADDNFLADKEFDISIDGQTHKVKATAVFLVHGVEPQEGGIYLLDFTLRWRSVETTQPDQNYYSREQAEREAELVFSSGQVESYANRQIQSWINLGH